MTGSKKKKNKRKVTSLVGVLSADKHKVIEIVRVPVSSNYSRVPL